MKNLISCTTSDMNFFEEQKYQNMLRDGVNTYFPADLKSEKQVNITIESSPHFLDLTKCQLYTKIQVYKFDKSEEIPSIFPALNDKDTISLANNFLHTLYSQADLMLNDDKIENKMLYGLQSYIQDLLGHNIERKLTCLQAQGWYNDTAGEMDNVVFLPSETPNATQTYNKGGVDRRHLLNKGIVEFLGEPHLDFFKNGKLLLNNTKLQLILTQANDSYCLLGSGSYKVRIIKAGLWVKKLTVNDQIQNALNQQIERNFANYDITLTKVVTRKIETAGLGETLTICTGLIPKTVILAIADYESTVIGKIGKNPFNFHHHNLTKLTLLENGVSYPYSSGIELNYTNNEYITGFMSLENCGKSIFGNGISRKDYAKGFTFYAFDMTPNGECGEIKDIDRNGTLSVSLQFESDTSSPLVLVCYLEYLQSFQFNKKRKLVTDKNESE